MGETVRHNQSRQLNRTEPINEVWIYYAMIATIAVINYDDSFLFPIVKLKIGINSGTHMS